MIYGVGAVTFTWFAKDTPCVFLETLWCHSARDDGNQSTAQMFDNDVSRGVDVLGDCTPDHLDILLREDIHGPHAAR